MTTSDASRPDISRQRYAEVIRWDGDRNLLIKVNGDTTLSNFEVREGTVGFRLVDFITLTIDGAPTRYRSTRQAPWRFMSGATTYSLMQWLKSRGGNEFALEQWNDTGASLDGRIVELSNGRLMKFRPGFDQLCEEPSTAAESDTAELPPTSEDAASSPAPGATAEPEGATS